MAAVCRAWRKGSRVAADMADGRKGPGAVSLWPDLTPFASSGR
jgi:hypothetical protein